MLLKSGSDSHRDNQTMRSSGFIGLQTNVSCRDLRSKQCSVIAPTDNGTRWGVRTNRVVPPDGASKQYLDWWIKRLPAKEKPVGSSPTQGASYRGAEKLRFEGHQTMLTSANRNRQPPSQGVKYGFESRREYQIC